MKKEKKGWMWFALSVLVCSAIAVGCVRFLYGTRFATGERVDGLLCGGMDPEDAAMLISETAAGRSIVLTDRLGEELCTLPLSALLADTELVPMLDELLRSGTGPNYTLPLRFTPEFLQPMVEELLFPGDYEAVEPRNAELIITDSGAEIIPAVRGNLYNAEACAIALSDALAGGLKFTEDLVVTVTDARQEPEITEDDPLLRKQLSSVNKWTEKTVEIAFLPGLTHTLTPAEILRMMDVELNDTGAKATLNNEKMDDVLDEIIDAEGADGVMAKYGRCAQTRDYPYLMSEDTGYVLDRDALRSAVRAALKGEGDGGVVEGEYDFCAYLRKKYGWLGDLNNVLEVSIDNQYIWFYRDNKLLTECPVVTGDLATNSITRKGTFQIYGKVADTNLKGPTWDDHVDYWMPFDGDIGIHDSSWRSEYGGNIYLTSGSHGCVNTPLESMGIIYDNAFIGMLVIVR